MSTTTLFTPGKLIQARKRLWRVDAQKQDVLHVTAVDAAEETARLYLPFEDVSLSELKPPDQETVGYPQMQDLMLRAFRLSMLHSTAPLLSLQRSRAIPVNYQLVPVVMALEQPKVRMLIADDVGLGKTIEAGLIITELIARGLARRLLVVCPASLREQWQQALAYFFHLEAHIFSRRQRRKLEQGLPAGTNLLEYHDAFVVSVDYAKTAAVKNQILEVPWDVVIIDEAHQVGKPHQSGPEQTVKKIRWDLGQALAYADHIDHLLLLTATPHNGYTDSYASLLRLLDVGAVSGQPHAPYIHKDVAQHHVIQRRRKDVEAWLHGGDGSAFPERDQDEVVIPPSQTELKVIDAVQHYGDLVLEHAKKAGKNIQTLAGWTVLHLHKRALSSPEALRQSLINRRETLEQRMDELIEPDAGLSLETARANVLDEDVGELFDEEEIVLRSERVAPGDQASLEAEYHALEKLQALANNITPGKDSKLSHLLRNVLRRRLHHAPKVIIFTRYRDTMSYVADQIEKANYYQEMGVDVVTLHGGLSDAQRRERFVDFEKADIAVMVATDAISEGINLQHYASQVIHYELPWNPNRLEQRNGRVDRFGQKADVVFIRTLVMDETLDATILEVLVKKAQRIRKDYGFSPPYFGDEANILDLIQEHGLGARLSPKQLSLFSESPTLSFVKDEAHSLEDPFEDETLERIKGDSFYGQTDISLAEVERRRREVARTIGSPQEVEAFIRSGLDRMRCTVRDNEDGTLRIVLNHPDLHLPGWEREIPQATFDPRLGLDHPEIEVLDLGHPLVRRLIDLIKRETFQAAGEDDQTRYGRTAVVVSPDVEEMTAVYALLVRFVTGTQPSQILEDLVTVALPVYGEEPFDPEQAQALLTATPSPRTVTDMEATEVLKDALERDDLEEHLRTQIEARGQELVQRRQAFQQRLGDKAEWAAGMDEIALSSWDLLAVKIVWPM
jgi:superfamily II DNA or RNA helicase